MSREAMKLALEGAYLAGFNASGEGYNAEYPFASANPVNDSSWSDQRDEYIREALAQSHSDEEQPAKEKAPQSANCEAPGWISSDHARGDDCTTEQPSTVTDNSQEWRGMDGATAYWLIQRHADGWPDIGKMMGEWLEANRAQPHESLTGGDERRHIICLCPDCTKPAQQSAERVEPVAEVKAKMTGGNVGIATVIHEIHSPIREPLQPGDKLYAAYRWLGWDVEQVWSERIFGIDMRFENVQDAIAFRKKLEEATTPQAQPAQQQEPVAIIASLMPAERHTLLEEGHSIHDSLYTSPPKRKPLTEQQIVDLCDGTLTTWEQVRIARAIEAAHGIKE